MKVSFQARNPPIQFMKLISCFPPPPRPPSRPPPVMLSAGFCHLLADAVRHVAFVGRFPMATFLAALGYIITLLADQVVHMVTDSVSGSSRYAQEELDLDLDLEGHPPPPGPSSGGHESKAGALPHSLPSFHDVGAAALIVDVAAEGHKLVGTSSLDVNGAGVVTGLGLGGVYDDDRGKLRAPLVPKRGPKQQDDGAAVKVFLAHRPLSFATAVLLACALCVHSVLEGMALGAQQTMQVRAGWGAGWARGGG